MSLHTIKITSNSSGSQTTCNSKQDDNQNSGRSIESQSSNIGDNIRSVTAIRGSVLQNNFEQSSCSALPNPHPTQVQQLDANYIFDNFSKLFIVKFDKQAPRPKDAQAQKSLLFMFEAIALQDKQRMKQSQQESQQNQKELQQVQKEQQQQNLKQSEQKEQENLTTPIQLVSQNSVNKESFTKAKTSFGEKSTFNSKAQRDSFYAQQLIQNSTKQQELQILDHSKEQKFNVLQSFNSQKCGQGNQTDKFSQKRPQSTAQSPLKLQIQENVCPLPAVQSKIPKKRNLSIIVTSPKNASGNFQNANSGILVADPGSIIEKHKRESSANLKLLETNQTITINQDKENYYNTEIYGQFNGGVSTNNSNNSNFINHNFNMNYHQRSKSNISYINLQTNSSSLTNYSINNNNLSATQISYFQNSLCQQQQQTSGQLSTKNSNNVKNCFQQSYTSCNNQSINTNKLVSKGNSKRKIVKISNKSQLSQQGKQNITQVNLTQQQQETQESSSNQNNTSNYILQQQQQCNNTLLNLNADVSKSLQYTQPVSKKSVHIINEDLFKLNTKNSNPNNKENLNINRKTSLKENTVNPISSVSNSISNNLKTSKYIFNFTNKPNNSQRNSFISSVTQSSQNEFNGVLGVLTQKFQNKKNLTNDSIIASNQHSLRQQCSNNTSIYNNILTEQQLSQTNETISSGQFISTRYNSKVRNTSRERSQNNSLKKSVNLKAISKNSKFNIRTISTNNPSSSTSMNSNNLYNAHPQSLNDNTFKSYNSSNIQSYQNIPDIVLTNHE